MQLPLMALMEETADVEDWVFFKAGDDSCREDYLMIPGGRDAREEDEARHSHDRLEERPSS